MGIRKWLKTVLLKPLYKDESITFNNVKCGSDDLYVEFLLDGCYEVESWSEFQERAKARSAVVKAKWSCGRLQQLADSVQEGELEISRAKELLETIRLDARTTRDRASVQLGQDLSGWF